MFFFLQACVSHLRARKFNLLSVTKKAPNDAVIAAAVTLLVRKNRGEAFAPCKNIISFILHIHKPVRGA